MKKTLKKMASSLLLCMILAAVAPAVLPVQNNTGTAEAASVKISKKKLTLIKGQTKTLKIEGTSSKVTWKSSNPKVASVTSKGKVTAKKKGTATITGKVNGKKYSCKVTVETPSLSKKSLTLSIGETAVLKVKGTTQKISWSSSDKNVAKVSSKGSVKAKKAGNAKITAKVGTKKYTCKVTVVKKSSKTEKTPERETTATSPKTEETPERETTATQAKTLVSNVIQDPKHYTIQASSVYFQDPAEYFRTTLVFGSIGRSGEYYVYNMTGSESDFILIQGYVDKLTGGGYNLIKTAEYYQKYSSTFFSWGLNYSGTGTITDKTQVNYTEQTANIMIYGTVERGKLKVHFWIPDQFDIVDLGLRADGTVVDTSTAGASATAGLYKLSDGSFETSDGRLHTSLGSAMVLRDGTAYTGTAVFKRDENGSRDIVQVEDYYRDEVLYFFAPMGRVMTGDVYTLSDIMQDNDREMTSAKSFTSYNWTLFFGAGHDGDFIYPTRKNDNFQDLTVRVMYYNKGVEAVYYICAKFDSAPYTVEALAAVSLKQTEGYTGAENEYKMKVGDTLSLTCGTEYGSSYHLFTWVASEGAGNVELSGIRSQTCTLTAIHTGTVHMQVTYEYSADYPDPLTGITRTGQESRTTDYTIYIE